MNELVNHQPDELILKHDNQNKLKDNEFYLAKVSKIFLARLLDLIIITIPLIIVTFNVKIDSLQTMLIINGSNFSFFVIYFSFIPLFFKGNTLGKLIMKIRLVHQSKPKITFWSLFFRETIFIYIPIFVLMLCTIAAAAIGFRSDVIAQNDKTGSIIYGIGSTFFFIWITFIGLSIKLQSNHQSSIDIRLNLFVIQTKPLTIEKKTNKIITRNDKHISLGYNQPGNLDEQSMKLIVKTDQDKINESIDIKKSENVNIGKIKNDIEPKREIESKENQNA